MITIRVADVGGSGKVTKADVLLAPNGTWSVDSLEVSDPINTANELVSFAIDNMPDETQGVAYSIAGVNYRNDLIVVSPNAHYLEGYKIASMTRQPSYTVTIKYLSSVYNDMQTTAAGVHVMREKAGIPPGAPFFVITIGTGIGGKYAFTVDKKLVILDSEIVHMVIDLSPFAPRCGDLATGHVEGMVSGPAIDGMVTRYLSLAGRPIPGKNPGAYLGEHFTVGAEWAKDLYDQIAIALAALINNLRCVYDFQHFVYKGSAGTDMFNRGIDKLVRRKLRKMLVNKKWADKSNLKFIETPGPNNVDALVGAAYLLAADCNLL